MFVPVSRGIYDLYQTFEIKFLKTMGACLLELMNDLLSRCKSHDRCLDDGKTADIGYEAVVLPWVDSGFTHQTNYIRGLPKASFCAISYLLYKVKEKELYLIFGAFMLFLEMYTTGQSIHTSINITMYLFKTCAQLGAFCISKKPD